MSLAHLSPLILVLLGLLTQGCAPRATPTAAIPLKVSVVAFLTYAPYFIAQEEGYFTEQGLQVEFVNFQRSSDAIPALAQGQLDVLGGSISFGLLNAITRGAQIKVVADKGYSAVDGCPSNAILVRKSLLEGGLNTADKVKPLRFALNPASYNGYAIDTALQKLGLDMTQVTTNDIPDAVQADAFSQGTIDVAVTAEPWVTRIVQTGHAQIWYPIQDILPNFQYGLVVFGPNLLEKNPDTGNRFMVAYLKGVQRYLAGKTERNLEILAKHTDLDKEFLKQACWPPFKATGQANIQSLLDFQAWAVQRKYLDTVVPLDKLWDGHFAEYGAKTLKVLQ